MAADSAEGSSELPKVGVSLSTLPPALATKLEQYDTNGNGIIDPSELPGPLTTAAAPYISVSAFPKKLQPVLHELDDEKNGKLEMDELTEIFSTYAELKKANKEGSISIKALPKEIQSTLKAFDVDGDGTVAPLELARGAELYKQSKKTTKRLVIFSCVLMVILCALVGVIVGLTAVVVEESKETKADNSGALVKKGTSTPVATAAATKSLALFDMPGQTAGVLSGVKRINLKQLGTLLGYTITGYRATDTKVTFLASSGDVVAVDNNFINVTSASGMPVYSEQKSAKRRRGLLADDDSTATVESSTTGNTAKAEANGVCFNLYHRHTETSGGLNPDSIIPKDKAQAAEECLSKCTFVEGCVGITMAGDKSVCYLKSAYDITKPYVFAGEGSWTDYYFEKDADKNGYAACMKKRNGFSVTTSCDCAMEKTEEEEEEEEEECGIHVTQFTCEDHDCYWNADKNPAECTEKAGAAAPAGEPVAVAPPPAGTMQGCGAEKAELADAQAAKKAAEDQATAAKAALADAQAAKKAAEDKATTAEAAKKTAEDALAAVKASATTQDTLTEAELRHRVKIWTLDEGAATCAFGEMKDWDVSSVTDMSNLFDPNSGSSTLDSHNAMMGCRQEQLQRQTSVRIPDISSWDVSKVTDMSNMFKGAQFDGGDWINAWDISNKKVQGMFDGSNFNQDISNWKFPTDLSQMFKGASAFNQPIGNWDVSQVTNMEAMFNGASAFNQPIGNWDLSKVTNIKAMFGGASSFNQDISNWKFPTDLSQMFKGASAFNQPIGNWDVSQVTNMEDMFSSASAFNKPIGNWDVSKVTKMNGMFGGASAFNQDINNWDVSNVKTMERMFSDNWGFNQPIGNWKTSNVENMKFMFTRAKAFNQPIGNWDVSNVSDMESMFEEAVSFNQDISKWNLSKVWVSSVLVCVGCTLPGGAKGMFNGATSNKCRYQLKNGVFEITGCS